MRAFILCIRHVNKVIESRKMRQTDRQIDMTKLIIAFRNFANAPKTIIFKRYQDFHKQIRTVVNSLIGLFQAHVAMKHVKSAVS